MSDQPKTAMEYTVMSAPPADVLEALGRAEAKLIEAMEQRRERDQRIAALERENAALLDGQKFGASTVAHFNTVQELVRATDQRDAALAMLREVAYEGGSEPGWKCIVCDYASPGHTPPVGHAPDCRLAALLKETDGT